MLRVFFKAFPVFLKTTLSFESFFSVSTTVGLLKVVGEDLTRAVVRVGMIRRGVDALAVVT